MRDHKTRVEACIWSIFFCCDKIPEAGNFIKRRDLLKLIVLKFKSTAVALAQFQVKVSE